MAVRKAAVRMTVARMATFRITIQLLICNGSVQTQHLHQQQHQQHQQHQQEPIEFDSCKRFASNYRQNAFSTYPVQLGLCLFAGCHTDQFGATQSRITWKSRSEFEPGYSFVNQLPLLDASSSMFNKCHQPDATAMAAILSQKRRTMVPNTSSTR